MKKLIFSLHVFTIGFLTNSVIHKAHFYNVTILFLMTVAFVILVSTAKSKRV